MSSKQKIFPYINVGTFPTNMDHFQAWNDLIVFKCENNFVNGKKNVFPSWYLMLRISLIPVLSRLLASFADV